MLPAPDSMTAHSGRAFVIYASPPLSMERRPSTVKIVNKRGAAAEYRARNAAYAPAHQRAPRPETCLRLALQPLGATVPPSCAKAGASPEFGVRTMSLHMSCTSPSTISAGRGDVAPAAGKPGGVFNAQCAASRDKHAVKLLKTAELLPAAVHPRGRRRCQDAGARAHAGRGWVSHSYRPQW